ncbi:hypothetical protein KAR91_62155, partial [Candidatus Pacearchaeota archaeon]|nr:hypothetical protein [Candidatus Pacearchaeota archaeon]
THKVSEEFYNMKQLLDQQKGLTCKIKEYKANLMNFMGSSAELADSDGSRLCTWRKYDTLKLDTETLKEKEPVIYKKYLNQKSHRRFLVY